MSNVFKPSVAITISLALDNGATDQFPQAKVYAAGSLITTINLSHAANGVYTGSWTPASNVNYEILFTVFSDAGHTTENTTFARILESWQPADVIVDGVWDEDLTTHPGGAGLVVTTIASEVDALASGLPPVLSDIYSAVLVVDGKVDAITTNLGLVAADVTSILALAGTTDTNVSQILLDLATVSGNVDDIEIAVGLLSTAVSDLTTDVSDVNAAVGAVSTAVGTLQTSVNGIALDVTQLLSDLATVNTNVNDIEALTTTIDANLTALIASTAIISGNVDDIETAVGLLTTNLATNNTKTALIEKILRNKLELADGSANNWVLYDDDGTTPLLTFDVQDKNGSAIVQPAAVPSRRSRGV